MSKQLLLGDEAIAQAALDAGLSGVYTPTPVLLPQKLQNTFKWRLLRLNRISIAVGPPMRRQPWKLH